MDKIKITEPNDGKHIAIAGDINSILASKTDTDVGRAVATYCFSDIFYQFGIGNCLFDINLEQ